MTLFDFQTSESHLAGETVRYRRWSQTTFKVDPVRHQGVCDPPSRWIPFHHQGGCDPPSRWIPSVIKVDAIHLQGRSRSTSMRSRTTLKVDPVPHECGREP